MQMNKAHRDVLDNIAAGRGAWFGAERPKQRGYRSGILGDLKVAGLIDWSGKPARYILTESGRAAAGLAPTHENKENDRV